MALNLDSWSRLDSREVRRILQGMPLPTLPSGQPALTRVVIDFTLVSLLFIYYKIVHEVQIKEKKIKTSKHTSKHT